MSKPTFGQLPGLQKAKQVAEISELIVIHRRFADDLHELFNALHTPSPLLKRLGVDDPFRPVTNSMVIHLQLCCEWHIAQANILEVRLEELNSPS
jgi:hypothetical protein